MTRLWLAFGIVMVASFSVLGWVGTRIYQEAPPLPDQVVTTDGKTVIASGDIGKGQNVWQAMGGMQVGSIWGHGSYVAPDWSADWLHRECVFILNDWAKVQGVEDAVVDIFFADLELDFHGLREIHSINVQSKSFQFKVDARMSENK